MPKYDLAVSFEGEQRELARSLSSRLDASGYSIFFDEFHRAALWGSDLTISLGSIYAEEARWCLVIVSKDYLRKPWTNLERQSALYRFMQDRAGYLLCLAVDDSKMPGLPSVIAYIDYRGNDEDSIYGLILQKIGNPAHDGGFAGNFSR